MSPSRAIRRIAIDGHFLDEIRTRLHTNEHATSVSFISAPVEQHQITEDEAGITLQVPALTALQLYRDRLLCADPRKSVEVSINSPPVTTRDTKTQLLR